MLINEMELGFAYYLAEKQTPSDSSGSPSSPSSPNSPDAQMILVICRYNRNCLKLIDILKRKLAELGILLNLSSAITFSELYPDHPLSHFIHQSQLYSTNPQNAEILFPIFTTNRSILYSPADQLILYQCLEDLGGSARKSTLLRIHQIASELKMAGKLTFAALKDAVIEARQNLSGVVQKNSEPLI